MAKDQRQTGRGPVSHSNPFDRLQPPPDNQEDLLLHLTGSSFERVSETPYPADAVSGPTFTPAIDGTNIIALSGSASEQHQPLPLESIRLLGVGGNFQQTVLQRTLDDLGGHDKDTDRYGMLHVQAQRDSTAAALVEADGTFSLNILNPDGNGYDKQKVGAVAGSFSLKEGSAVGCTAEDGQQALRASLCSLPALDVLAFCLNEKAISADSDAVRLITSALNSRMQVTGQPLHVISTVNYKDNADAVFAAIVESANQLKLPELIDWMEHNVHVHNSVVDRMVWRTDDNGIGTEMDPGEAVQYMPLVFETRGTTPLPVPFEQHPFCRVTDSLEAWEQQKLWGANGPHTFMASIGLPLGFRSVKDLLADSFAGDLVEQYTLDVAVPALEGAVPVPGPNGIAHEDFSRSFVDRNRAAEMHPGFICQGMLDHKVNVRISDPIAAASQAGQLNDIDQRVLVVAYAAALRAGTPIVASSKPGVFEIPLDPTAESSGSSRESYTYVPGDDKTPSLEIHPGRRVYDLRSEASERLLGLWGADESRIQEQLVCNGTFELLGVRDTQLISETSSLLADLIRSPQTPMSDVIRGYLATA